MNKNLLKRSGTNRLFRYMLGVIIITLQASLAQAQLFTQNFNGIFPPVGPPAVTTPVGTGLADEGAVQWYRGDSSVVTNGGNTGINPGVGATGFAACFNTWDINSGGKADMVFNDIDLSSVAPFGVLKFWMINKSGTDVIRVFARNGTDPWTAIGNATYGVFTNFTEVSISLSAFSGAGFTAVDIRFEGTSDYGSDNIAIDDVSIALPSPMSFVSTTAFQKANDREIFKPLANQQILRMNIVTAGISSPLVANTFYLTSAGTTSLADITNARLWTTGNASTFNAATATPMGSIGIPGATLTFSGVTTPLVEGNNYIWLTFDITTGATVGNVADATFDSVKIGTTTRIPTLASPSANRLISPATIFNLNAITGSTSGNGRGPATQSLFNRSISIYPAADYSNLKAGDMISSVGFETIAVGTATVSGNIKIYLQNTTDATFIKSATFATAITDMVLVYDGPLTIANEAGTYDIRLTTPYAYTGTGIYMAFDWALTSATGGTSTYGCTNATVGGGNGNRSSFGAAVSTGALGSSAFRPAVRFGVNAFANDVAIVAVNTLTKFPRQAASPHLVNAVVKNNGYNRAVSYTVSLNVTGANFMGSNKQVTLEPQESATVVFNNLFNINNGTNNVTVSVASDDVNTNNSITVLQDVNNSTYSYSDASAPASAIGYNTGAGMILTKFKANGGWLIDTVRVFIASTVDIEGKQMFGVVLNSAGTIIAKSDTFTATLSDLGKYKSFAMATPKVVFDEDFYVGLSQVANTVGFFPVAYQAESPIRSGAYYTAPSAGGIPAEANTFGRFMIEANTATPLPPQTVNIGVDTVLCPGDSVTLNAGNAGMTYLWSTGATTQTIIAKNAGTYSVTVRNAQGYPVTDSKVISVGPTAVTASLISDNTKGVCVGTPITFTANGLNIGAAPTYQWKVNSTVIATATGRTFTSSTLNDNDTVKVAITSNSGCITGNATVSASIVVDIFPILPVSITIAANTSLQVCMSDTLTFTASQVNGGTQPYFQWTINGSPVTGENGVTFVSNTLNNNDTVRCLITPSESCDGIKTSNPIAVSILSPATAGFTKTTTIRTVQFTNLFTNTANFMWNFGDGATSNNANPTHTYAKDSTYTVTLMAVNSCGGDTSSQTVAIKTKDFAAASIIGLSDGCALSNLTVIRLSVQNLRADAAQGVSVSYQLNNGAINAGTIATIAANGTATANFTQRADLSADGTYTIKAWVNDAEDINRANDTVTLVVKNQAKPDAKFVSQNGVNGSVSFVNQTTSDVTATYAWDFGDNGTSTDANPTHAYTQTGTYNVKLIATSTCGNDTASADVSVVVSGISLQANERYVRAYPNPSNGLFNLALQLTSADNITINVYNTNGQIVHTQKLGYINNENVSLDLSNLSPGIYNVNIQGQSTQITKRVNIVK